MKGRYWITYIIIVIVQMILYNYCRFTPYLILTLLPVIVFCMPVDIGAIGSMFIAFATGLAVDYFSEGIIGLNAAALLPVALFRRPVISMLFGSEPFERHESISMQKYGVAKMSLGMIIMITLFFLVYILLDSAGSRPAWFLLLTLACSVPASYLLSLVIVNQLTYDDRR